MRRTKEEARQTREAILNAGLALFATRGYAATGLGAIATSARVTRGAVYWHFKNKTDIFDAIHDRFYRSVTESVLLDLEKDHPEPLVQLRNLCVQILLNLESDTQKRQAATFFVLKCDYAGELQPYRQRHNAKKSAHLKLLARYFERAKRTGALPADADARILARALNCYMKGIVVEHLNHPREFQLKKLAPAFIELFLSGLSRSRRKA